MKKLILDLITKLDMYDDALLIGLLNQKINNIKDYYDVTDKEIDLKCTPLSYSYAKYFQTDLINNRIEKLKAKVKNCEYCENKTIEHSYKVILQSGKKYEFTKECKLCPDEYNRCIYYQRKLKRLISDLCDIPTDKARDYLINNEETRDLIKTKIILSKINLKLKNYDASKH